MVRIGASLSLWAAGSASSHHPVNPAALEKLLPQDRIPGKRAGLELDDGPCG
jgi:hypothetical protein